jgi:hypothetical protein
MAALVEMQGKYTRDCICLFVSLSRYLGIVWHAVYINCTIYTFWNYVWSCILIVLGRVMCVMVKSLRIKTKAK